MSPFGLFASALICAKSSPVAFWVTLTLMPVTFSKPIATPWHHAVSGELQYMANVPCARAALARKSAANPANILQIMRDSGGHEYRSRFPCVRKSTSDAGATLRRWPAALFCGRAAADFLVPLLEQALALRRRTVFGEVVVDELDVGGFRRQRRDRRIDVRRQLERRLGFVRQLLRRRRQCPVVEFFGIVEVARTLDERHRADLVTGAF